MSTAWFKMLLVAVLAAAVGVAATLLIQARRESAHTDHAAPSPPAENGSGHNHKQLWTCGMHPQVLKEEPGICPICHMKLTPLKSDGDDSTTQSTASKGQKKVLYWWDPMLGPSSIADKPGKSAMRLDRVPVYESDMSAGPKVTIDPTVVQNM